MKMISQALIAGLVLSSVAFAETKAAPAAEKVAVASVETPKKVAVKHNKMAKAKKSEKVEAAAPVTK